MPIINDLVMSDENITRNQRRRWRGKSLEQDFKEYKKIRESRDAGKAENDRKSVEDKNGKRNSKSSDVVLKEQEQNIPREKKERIIPCQVLEVFWDQGIRVEKSEPMRGMSLKRFLGLLWNFAWSCEDVAIWKAALHLYEDTVRFELMPNWKKKLRPKKPVVRYRPRKERVRTLRSGCANQAGG